MSDPSEMSPDLYGGLEGTILDPECSLCPHGSYNNGFNRNCTSCPDNNFTTSGTGATSEAECNGEFMTLNILFILSGGKDQREFLFSLSRSL